MKMKKMNEEMMVVGHGDNTMVECINVVVTEFLLHKIRKKRVIHEVEDEAAMADETDNEAAVVEEWQWRKSMVEIHLIVTFFLLSLFTSSSLRATSLTLMALWFMIKMLNHFTNMVGLEVKVGLR
ncbi:hypothetical protein PIB30_087459 [Stylosanthes scabra]|uniref:Transmembrane protein n=1 Tax=Stylosanthes scabra TaxID=79078 RepID=A0ABU6RTA9_9FABA|nr:hypothetical protein [Stylosanthes scabra]